MMYMKRCLTAGIIVFFIAFMSAASEYIKDARQIIHVSPDGTTTVVDPNYEDSGSISPDNPYINDLWDGNDSDRDNIPTINQSDDGTQDDSIEHDAPTDDADADGTEDNDNNDEDTGPDGDSSDEDIPSGTSGNDNHIDADDIFVLYNSEKLTQNQKPDNKSENGLTASLAKNESEGMQFVVRPSADITGAKITVSELRDSKGNRISNVEIYRQHYIQVSSGPSGLLAPGLYPDALIPIYDGSDSGFDNSRSNIDANKNQGYWITVTTSKNQPAGDYYGTVKFSCDQSKDITIPIRVTVWDFALPDKSSAQAAFMLTNTDYYTQFGISEHEAKVMYWEFSSNTAYHRDICRSATTQQV